MGKRRSEVGRFSNSPQVEGISKRNSSRLAKNSLSSLSDEAKKMIQNRYLKHLESDNISAKKGGIENISFAKKEDLILPKKKERKKGKLEDIRRLPLQISLQTAIQEARYDGDEGEEKNNEKKDEKVKINYITINSQSSKRPSINLCGMCGFIANYTCITCKANYCSISCKENHNETRCMKWKV